MSYSNESDPDRIRQMAQQGIKDVEWLVKKVWSSYVWCYSTVL